MVNLALMLIIITSYKGMVDAGGQNGTTGGKDQEHVTEVSIVTGASNVTEAPATGVCHFLTTGGFGFGRKTFTKQKYMVYYKISKFQIKFANLLTQQEQALVDEINGHYREILEFLVKKFKNISQRLENMQVANFLIKKNMTIQLVQDLNSELGENVTE